MKIISLVSSGRKNGNNEKIVKLIENQLQEITIEKNTKIEIEHINLNDYNIKFCKGCRVCFDKGEEFCPQKDDLLIVRDKIASADGIILASPVYVEDINGVMKNWIDRMAFNCHRPAFAGKSALIITTSGVGSSSHALGTMKSALTTWGFKICGQYKFRAGANMEKNEMISRYGNQIKTAAIKLFESINNYKIKGPSFYSLMAFKVQQKYWERAAKENNTFECLFWKKKGWLEKACTYYINNNSSVIKVKLARFVGSIISIFFI